MKPLSLIAALISAAVSSIALSNVKRNCSGDSTTTLAFGAVSSAATLNVNVWLDDTFALSVNPAKSFNWLIVTECDPALK